MGHTVLNSMVIFQSHSPRYPAKNEKILGTSSDLVGFNGIYEQIERDTLQKMRNSLLVNVDIPSQIPKD
jgi:hypothetical protein